MYTTQELLDKSFDSMILSASGWRKVFAASSDEEDPTPEISAEDALICVAVSEVFGAFLNNLEGEGILLARDARPTGKVICSIIYKTLVKLGYNVKYCGVCSAPEIMAQSAVHPYKGFVYVSASHNPIGHNGIKGGCNGGVFGQETANILIEELKNRVKDCPALLKLYEEAQSIEVVENKELKQQCLSDYRAFVLETACPDGNSESFISKVKACEIGIVGDLNGSARCSSIDKSFLSELGFKTAFINDECGKVAHAIVPEGENLRFCRDKLEQMHDADPSYVLGYTPDNDGDRGNLVFIDTDGRAKIIEAQDVFALCVYAVLRNATKAGMKNLAVAVNGPTSMRIDALSKSFGAKTFRAEVGEANAVNLGEKLRKDGYSVPILGEGSNGGNITYPAKVRDPMNTIMSMASLLADGITIPQALSLIPPYTTTSAFAPEAIVRLKTRDFGALKTNYEKAFPAQWKNRKETLRKFGIESFTEIRTKGICEYTGVGNGTSGGLKMAFSDASGDCLAYIWMRPSGTEPVLRILSDVKGKNKELHDLLLSWQREMIESAARSE